MKYQKIINLLENTANQPTKFRTKKWVEINDESRGTYKKDDQIRFKTSILRSSLCNYSDAYILVKGTITIAQETAAAPSNDNKKVIFENHAPYTGCISRINNAQVEDAQYIDVAMPMYNLIEYSDNYSKISGILWQYCRDKPAVNDNSEIIDFTVDNTEINSFQIKEKLTGKTGSNGTKNVEIIVPLKYLSNFWRTYEIH